MATREDVLQIIELLSSLPNNPLASYEPETPEGKKAIEVFVNAYFSILEDIPTVFLQAAALQYLGSDNKFFPSNPGTLRDIAFDLEMMAQGIPTPSMAWAMVLRGPKMIEARLCETGVSLREAAFLNPHDQKLYFKSLSQYSDHVDSCDICMPTSREGSYGSKVVDEAVKLMGGRDVIFTDNATADRARFLEAYRELIMVERRRLQMHPKVADLIADPDRPRLGQTGEAVNLLAAKLSAGGASSK